MAEARSDRGYWALDLPGLNSDQAEKLLDAAGKLGLEYGGTAVDPTQWLVLILDEASVRGLAAALRASDRGAPAQPIPLSADPVAAGLLEVCDEWLEENATQS